MVDDDKTAARKVADSFIELLGTGKWPAQREVAIHAGVAIATVTRNKERSMELVRGHMGAMQSKESVLGAKLEGKVQEVVIALLEEATESASHSWDKEREDLVAEVQARVDALAEMQEEFELLEGSHRRCQVDLDVTREALVEANQVRDKEKEGRVEATEQLQKLTTRYDALERSAARSESQLSDSKGRLEALNDLFREELEKHSNAMAQARERTAEAESNAAAVNAELVAERKMNGRLAEECEGAKSDLREMETQHRKDMKLALERHDKQLADMAANNADLREANEALHRKEIDLERRNAALHASLRVSDKKKPAAGDNKDVED